MENRLTWGDLFHDVIEDRLSRITEIERCMNLVYPIVIEIDTGLTVLLFKDGWSTILDPYAKNTVSYNSIPNVGKNDYLIKTLKHTIKLIS